MEVFSKWIFFLFSSQAYRPLGLIVVLSSLTLNVKMVPRRSQRSDEIVDMDERFWRKKSADHSAFLSINQDNSSEVLGFAHLDTVCSYYVLRSISVTYMYSTKGQMLNTAKVLAHEIGHALGMSHDNTFPREFNKLRGPLLPLVPISLLFTRARSAIFYFFSFLFKLQVSL